MGFLVTYIHGSCMVQLSRRSYLPHAGFSAYVGLFWSVLFVRSASALRCNKSADRHGFSQSLMEWGSWAAHKTFQAIPAFIAIYRGNSDQLSDIISCAAHHKLDTLFPPSYFCSPLPPIPTLTTRDLAPRVCCISDGHRVVTN